MIEVKRKRMIFPAMWVMQCLSCGKILASAAEKELLPDVVWCDCDERKGGGDDD